MAQFPTELIPCLVIQLNNTQFITENSVKGRTLLVPCKNILLDDDEYWMVPIKDYMSFSGLRPYLTIGDHGIPVPQPTYDSFKVFRVRDKLSGNTYWIYGTKDQFLTSASVTGSTPTPMPGINGAFVQRVSPCDKLCAKDINGNFFLITSLPSLPAGWSYSAYGSRNNVAYANPAAGGYASVAALLTFLNATFTPYTWTNPSGSVIYATGGALNDILCISIVAQAP